MAGSLALGAALGGVAFYTISKYTKDLPSVESLKAGYEPPQITRVHARDGSVLASLFVERRTVIPFEQVPKAAKLAFLAAEDASFYEHEGLNYWGLLRAVLANARAGKSVQGGSTITQQVVKNVLLDAERSLRRKVRETVLALRLEHSLSKDEIFWLYLNHIYLGHGRYGIEEASRYYFGKRAREIGLDESAVLAGLIASPENYSPRKDPEKALDRRRYVLRQMLEKGFVTQELHDQVAKIPLRLAPAAEHESALVPEVIGIAKAALERLAPAQASIGGFAIQTTIDPDLQAAARSAVRKNLDEYMERHKLQAPYISHSQSLWAKPHTGKVRVHRIYTGIVAELDDQLGTIEVRVGDVVGRVTLSTETRYNPKRLLPSAFTKVGAALRVGLLEVPKKNVKPQLRLELGPQSAFVAIDVRTREVLALVGSYEAISGGLDRATRARRQPGSTFKPVVYSYALHSRRFAPATMIAVHQRGHGVPDRGPLAISVRDALAHSNNEASVHLLRESGTEQVLQWAKALGIDSKLQPDLSLALGAYEVTPLEMTNAYVAFANGGLSGTPRFIREVKGPDGVKLALPSPPPERPVLSDAEAYLTTSLLRSVITDGTGRRALKLGREVAGKTGTTNDNKDAWFIGYSTDIVAAVWVGFDDARPLGRLESGAKAALPAWIYFMEASHQRKPKTRFSRPAGVLEVDVDARSGLLPRPGQENVVSEEFLDGTEPSEIAPAIGDAGAPAADSDREGAAAAYPPVLSGRVRGPADAGAIEIPSPPPF